jgi:hypothetical protein
MNLRYLFAEYSEGIALLAGSEILWVNNGTHWFGVASFYVRLLLPGQPAIAEKQPRLFHEIWKALLHTEVPGKLNAIFHGFEKFELGLRLHGDLVELEDLNVVW